MSVVPDLWGIDPDEVYKWTPKAQREVLDKGKWNEKKREWDSLPTYGKPLAGAPVVFVAAPSGTLTLAIENARTRYRTVWVRGWEKTKAAKGDVNDYFDDLAEKGTEIYSPELIERTLSECVVDWENVKHGGKVRSFKRGDWKHNSRHLSGQEQAELFYAILAGSLFEGAECDPFVSSPA